MSSASSPSYTGTRVCDQERYRAMASSTVISAGREKTTVRGVMISATRLLSSASTFLMADSS